MYDKKEIDKNPTQYAFTMNAGYKFVGSLRLPLHPVGAPEDCEPPYAAPLDSWHRLIPPKQADGIYVRLQWDPSRKIWLAPPELQSRRLAYTSQYLAAVGWKYGEAE